MKISNNTYTLFSMHFSFYRASDANSVYINTIPHVNLTDDPRNLSLRVHNDLTSLAVAQEIKNTNSNSNNLSFDHELSPKACAAFDDDTYEFPPDVMEEKPKIMEEKPKFLKEHKSDIDNSFNDDKSFSGDNDNHSAEPELEFPFHLKRTTSFRKAAYSSFKHKFSKNKVSSKCPDSVDEFVVIANEHINEHVNDHVNGCVNGHVIGCASGCVNGQIASSPFSSAQNTVDHEQSRLPNGVSKKKVYSNPK